MTVKNVLKTASIAMLLSITVPAAAHIMVSDTTQINATAKTDDMKAQELLLRLKDIKDMDKSVLSRVDKKSLRKEVKESRKELRALKGGIYLSVGAIIIIILLLIILL